MSAESGPWILLGASHLHAVAPLMQLLREVGPRLVGRACPLRPQLQ